MPATCANPFIRTKIIATLGPASATRERFAAMLDAGLDICRLNFSHGDLDQHAHTLELVRAVAAERDCPLCVIGDLSGPKIRLGRFEHGPVELATGATVRFVRATARMGTSGSGAVGKRSGAGAAHLPTAAASDADSTADRMTVTYPAFVDEVAPGHRIFIDDGLVRLVAKRREGDALVAEVTNGGPVDTHKGVNLPDTQISTPALTEKDRGDLDWAIAHKLEYVALSFVREPEDLYELKRIIKQRGSSVKVIPKIEKTQALWHLEELIANSDAVLVARGDLGVETDLWRVPLIQKDIVADCRAAGVPVIVATQMLQSMITNPAPTRAEVSDVANAIIDQADAVMLSGETAVGAHPVQSVEIMNRIAGATEEYLAKRPVAEPAGGALPDGHPLTPLCGPTAAIAHAAVAAACDLGARLVAVWTATGTTARLLARHRLPMPVVALTPDPCVQRQLSLVYGLVPLRMDPIDNPAAMSRALDGELIRLKLAAAGDLIVMVTSTRPTTPGATDTTLVRRVGEA